MIIRINLHPNRKPKTKANPYKGILAVCFLIAAILLGVILMASESVDTQTRKIKADNAKIQTQIDEINKELQEVAKIREKISELNRRSIVLGKLASIRKGPQYVLNELSRLLSNPKDVMARKEATELGWLLAWEPENVMIESFKDIGDSQIEIKGKARSMDDIQEFWTRMKTSTLLRNIRLEEIKDAQDSVTRDTIQSFVFRTDANFNYQTARGRALVDLLTQEPDESAETQNQEAAPAQP